MSSRTDAQIHKDVVDELAFEPSIDTSRIAVAVADGIVTLSGIVPSYWEKWSAETAVKRVGGVQGFAEELTVHMLPSTQQTETDLATTVRNALEWDALIPQNRVQAKVEDGWITLEGKLEWQYQRQRAHDSVANLRGVKGVTNLIALTPVVQSADIRAKVVSALERSADLDASKVQVEVSAGSVTLRGHLPTWAERDTAGLAAWSAAGVNNVSNDIVVNY